MNKWKESELVRSLVGFFLLFLLFIGLFIFVVPSTHQSSKIAEKIERNGTKPVIDAAKRNKKLFLRPFSSFLYVS